MNFYRSRLGASNFITQGSGSIPQMTARVYATWSARFSFPSLTIDAAIPSVSVPNLSKVEELLVSKDIPNLTLDAAIPSISVVATSP